MSDEEKAIQKAYGVDAKTAHTILIELRSLNETIALLIEGKTAIAAMSALLTHASSVALNMSVDEDVARDFVDRAFDQIFKRLKQCKTADPTD